MSHKRVTVSVEFSALTEAEAEEVVRVIAGIAHATVNALDTCEHAKMRVAVENDSAPTVTN